VQERDTDYNGVPVVRIDLNADVGERSAGGPQGDGPLLRYVTSANIACGFHAGGPSVMRQTVDLAAGLGVAVGAHPGFPDIEGFGRRELTVSPQDVEDFVVYQVGALAAIAAAQGVRLQHVKPHGALFNMAARDPALADAVARAAKVVDPALILFGLPGSALVLAGERAGLRVAREGFADRAYQRDGTLVPRSREGSVITDQEAVVRRAVRFARDQRVECIDGIDIHVPVETLCVHGDTPGAADLAARIRGALAGQGIDVRAVGTP
jgi:UPF0271 protein